MAQLAIDSASLDVCVVCVCACMHVGGVYVCVCMHVGGVCVVCVRACVCMHACVCVCNVHACKD